MTPQAKGRTGSGKRGWQTSLCPPPSRLPWRASWAGKSRGQLWLSSLRLVQPGRHGAEGGSPEGHEELPSPIATLKEAIACLFPPVTPPVSLSQPTPPPARNSRGETAARLRSSLFIRPESSWLNGCFSSFRSLSLTVAQSPSREVVPPPPPPPPFSDRGAVSSTFGTAPNRRHRRRRRL